MAKTEDTPCPNCAGTGKVKTGGSYTNPDIDCPECGGTGVATAKAAEPAQSTDAP